jgi:hypothetical protein
MYGKDVMVIFLGVIITLVALVGAFEGGIPKGMEDDNGNGKEVWRVVEFRENPIQGHSTENSQSVEIITIDEAITTLTEIRFTLTWKDEPDETITPGPLQPVTLTNQPDQFALDVETPWGYSNMTDYETNQHDKEGLVSLVLTLDGKTGGPEQNVIEVAILCGECGDQVGPAGIYSQSDGGNSWLLTVEYEYLAK